MRNYKELQIWQKGIETVKEVYLFSKKLPLNEQYGLRSQITRSAVSIPSNIAEGCSRSSKKDFARFLEIALGSSYELDTQLHIAELVELCDEKEAKNIIELNCQLQRMITTYLNKIR